MLSAVTVLSALTADNMENVSVQVVVRWASVLLKVSCLIGAKVIAAAANQRRRGQAHVRSR